MSFYYDAIWCIFNLLSFLFLVFGVWKVPNAPLCCIAWVGVGLQTHCFLAIVLFCDRDPRATERRSPQLRRATRGRLFLTRANPRRAIAKTIFNHTARAWFLPGPVHTCCFVGWSFRGPVNAFPDYFNKLFLIILPHSNLLQTSQMVQSFQT